MNKILLSFDVEEFDMPLEYNFPIGAEEQMRVAKQGLEVVLPVLEKYHIPATMFTTASFALRFPDAVRSMASVHEIASHTYYHSKFENEHLASSKQVLEEISGHKVYGLRLPRMRAVDMNEVKEAGYLYDSSVNPTLIPGRYNMLHLSRTCYYEKNVLRIPASVSPVLRIPLFWLAFKNYPYRWFLNLCKRTLKKDGYLCLYFHPWEFVPIRSYGLPKYVCTPNGTQLLERLERLINDLQPFGSFTTIHRFLSEDRKMI